MITHYLKEQLQKQERETEPEAICQWLRKSQWQQVVIVTKVNCIVILKTEKMATPEKALIYLTHWRRSSILPIGIRQSRYKYIFTASMLVPKYLWKSRLYFQLYVGFYIQLVCCYLLFNCIHTYLLSTMILFICHQGTSQLIKSSK